MECVWVCVHVCVCASMFIHLPLVPKMLPLTQTYLRLVNRSFCAQPHDRLLSQNIAVLHSVFTPKSMKFVSQSESLHFDSQVPAIDVHVARRSIGYGCGAFEARWSLWAIYKSFLCLPAGRPMSSSVAVWPDGLCQLGFPNDVSIQGFPAVCCRFFFLSRYFNVKGWR